MLTFVVDADACIKLAKANVLELLASQVLCIVTKTVYGEIIRGKEKMYDDAFSIESFVQKKMLHVQETKHQNIEGLGQGECSILEYIKKHKSDVVISDDGKFLSFLERENIPFMTVTDTIVFMVFKKYVSKDRAIGSLQTIQTFVSRESYNAAIEMLGGK